MQKGLALFGPAGELFDVAVFFNLGDMPDHLFPTFDLPGIVFAAAAHVVTAVPLKPSSWILPINPIFLLPVRKGLRGIDFKKVEFRIMKCVAQFGFFKPFFREFFLAIGHIFPPKNPQFEHLLGGELGFEFRVKIFSDRFGQEVGVILLHQVVHGDFFLFLLHRFLNPEGEIGQSRLQDIRYFIECRATLLPSVSVMTAINPHSPIGFLGAQIFPPAASTWASSLARSPEGEVK